MKNKKGFTLLEVLLSIIILGMFIGTVITIYIKVRGSDSKMVNKRLLTSEASDLIDEIHEAALNYTIDYEEYFNKSYNDNTFTTYGNEGIMYYCGNTPKVTTYYKVTNSAGGENLGCPEQGNQKYLEYYSQHFIINNMSNLNSSQNLYEGEGPIAITNNGVDYLYLINGDGTERYYFRRVYKGSKDVDGIVGTEGKNEKLFTIQMLKLKGFDAGVGHDYVSWGAYDGFIDTRACDTVQGFICEGSESLQNGYTIPLNENHGGWIDLTSDKVTVNDFKVEVYPIKDPYLAVNETEYRIDPYAKISFTMNMYGQESDDEITVSTTLSFKNSYRKFPIIEYTGYIADF